MAESYQVYLDNGSCAWFDTEAEAREFGRRVLERYGGTVAVWRGATLVAYAQASRPQRLAA